MTKIKSLVNEKQVSRSIVKEIQDFGVTEDQKIDIMYFLSLIVIKKPKATSNPARYIK